MEIPQKTTQLPYDPAIPLLGTYAEEPFIQKDTCKRKNRKDTRTPVLTAAKHGNKLNIYPDQWVKMWSIHTMDCDSAVERKERTAFAATRMDLEIIVLSEVSHQHRMLSLPCGI